MKEAKKRNPLSKLNLKFSTRMSLRYHIAYRTSLIMLLAIIPFSMERFFSSENALAHTKSTKNIISNHDKKIDAAISRKKDSEIVQNKGSFKNIYTGKFQQ